MLIATWHPTFAFFHNPYEWGAFEGDLDRFARAIRGELKEPPRDIFWKPKARDIRRLHKLARQRGLPIACDIETAPEHPDWPWTGKDPTRAKLRCVGFGHPDAGWSVWWDFAGPKMRAAIKALLEDGRVQKVFHNGYWFDLRVLARYGLAVRNVFDTRDARRALSATSALKLAYITSLYTDAHPWKEKEEDDEKGLLIHTKSKKKLRIYNAYDCCYTARDKDGMVAEPEWNTPRVQRLFEHQTRLSQIAAEMHTTGIKVDTRMREWLAWALMEEYKEKEAKLLRKVGIKGFECTPNHIRALIYAKHAEGKYAHLGRFYLPDPIDPGMYVNPKDPDTISVDEDALILLLIDPSTPKELKEIIELYWDAEGVWKSRSVFVVSKLIDHAIGADGRLRAGWNSCGTDTGRFSCREPNLMNIEKLLRAMYVAESGYTLIGADYKSLEIRVMRYVAEDDALGEAILAGDTRKDKKTNVYVEEAKTYFDLPAHFGKSDLKDDAYKSAKIIRLARQYGAKKKKVFQIAVKQKRDMTWQAVDLLVDRFDKRNWRTVKYWEEEHARVAKCGYSASRIMDRRRYYPRLPDIPETANYPIQSTAADIKNLALIRIAEALAKYHPRSRVVLDLHDAIYVESPVSEKAAVARLMQDCMEVPVELMGKKVSFPVEIGCADRWSDIQ